MFSCGSVYEDFIDQFCNRCNKCKKDINGIPLDGNCKTEEQIAECYFLGENFPHDDLIQGGPVEYVCKHFKTDDKELIDMYNGLMDIMRDN